MSKAKSAEAEAPASDLIDELFSGPSLRVAPVDHPGRKRVWVREFNGVDRQRLFRVLREVPDATEALYQDGYLAALYLCTEAGDRYLDPVEHGPRLATEMSIGFLRAIVEKGEQISALTQEAVAGAKANFEPTPSDASTSDSPATSGE